MRLLPLSLDTANQSMSFVEDGSFYTVAIRTVFNVSLITITRNGEVVVSSKRCVPSQFLLMKYQMAEFGNFAFINASNEYPNYVDFGVTTFLAYYSPSEMAGAKRLL